MYIPTYIIDPFELVHIKLQLVMELLRTSVFGHC